MLNYAAISDESFNELWSFVRVKHYRRGDYLLRYGSVAKKMIFVYEGIVISLYNTQDDSVHIKNFFTEGRAAASMVSMLTGRPSSFALQALDEVEVLEIPYEHYSELIARHDDLKDFYIAYLEKNWVIENERKQIAFATEAADQRYLTFLEDYPGLEKRVAQKNIASYLGITPTQLSRIRQKLRSLHM